MPANKSRAQQRRRAAATGRPARPGARRAPRRPSGDGMPSATAIGAGVIAVAALVAGVSAGVGAAIVTAGVLGASWYVAVRIVEAARGERPLVAAQKSVVLALVFLLPVVIDPRSSDIFATVKFSVLTAGASALLALWLADLVLSGRARRWTPLHALVGAFVGWAVVSTVASGHVALSTLGNYSSNNGLATTAAFAVLFVATAATFRPRDLSPLVEVLFFGAGGVVIGYAVLQLLDRALPGPALDPVVWPSASGLSALSTSGVWSTLGNPNHVGGFCAILLPLGVALVSTGTRWTRTAALSILAAALLVIVQTSSRGAWLAALLSLAVVTVLERRRIGEITRGRRGLIVGAGAVGMAAAMVSSMNSGLLAKGTDQLFQLGGTGTIAQRLQFWRTTLTMSGDEPLVGFGLDSYRLTWPHYVRPRFIRTWGYDLVVTGPHNTFLATLYGGGWPLLVLLVALLVAAAVALVAGVRRLRATGDDTGATLLSALAVAGAAYVVVASFNVERLELAAILWVLLGVVAAVRTADAPVVGRARNRVRRANGEAVARAAAVAVVAVAAVVGVVTASRPWRADRDLASVQRISRTDVGNDRLAARERSDRTLAHLRRAVDTNPWEARYLREFGDQMRGAGIAGASGDEAEKGRAVSAFEDALTWYERAASYTPRDLYVWSTAADVRFRLSSVLPDAAEDLRRTGFADLRALLRYAPHAGDIRAYYATRLAVHGQDDAAVAAIEAALREFPDDDAVLQAADRVYRAVGKPDVARRYADRRAAIRKREGSTSATSTTLAP